uniref:Uncharacterized protein n=1 Tax=Solanum tuberosum TaxID=4113 RepID=M1BM26_SOLTU
MVTIIEGRIARRDGCMDRYVPHGSRTERQRVTSLDSCGTCHSLLFQGFWEICEVVVLSSQRSFLLPVYDLVLL